VRRQVVPHGNDVGRILGGVEADAQAAGVEHGLAVIFAVAVFEPQRKMLVEALLEGVDDGEPQPGLSADDYSYTVGSGVITPEVDEQLRGAKAGVVVHKGPGHAIRAVTWADS